MTRPQPTALYPEQAVPIQLSQPRSLAGGRVPPVPDAQSATTRPLANLHVATPVGHQVSFQPAPGSQLSLFHGASPNESNMVSRRSGNPVMSSRNGRGVKTACTNCRKVSKRCDPGRPCSRCRKLGLEGCEDAPSKREKPIAHNRGRVLLRNVIRTEIRTFIGAQQVPQFDPVSATTSSTSFVSTEITVTSTYVETQCSPPSAQLPADDVQPAETYASPGPSTSEAGTMLRGVAESWWASTAHWQGSDSLGQIPAIAPTTAPQTTVYPTAYDRVIDTQAPPYLFPPASVQAPQAEALRPDSFHHDGQPYPNAGSSDVHDPLFDYQWAQGW